MKQNFFITLREIKESLGDSKNPNYVNITDETRKGFKEFTSFIEECALFPGKRFYSLQYVCKYWYLSQAEIHNRYCRETGKQVSASAISQSMTRATMAYSKVFGLFDLYEVFDGKHNKDIDDLLLLCDLIIEDAESGLMPIFISEVYDYNTSKKHGVYNLADCLSEIEMLRANMKSTIFNKLDTVDSDKLLYLLDVSKQPLFNTKDDSINQNKFKLLTYLKGKDYFKYNNIVGEDNTEDIFNQRTIENQTSETDGIFEDEISENYAQSDSEDVTLDFDFDNDIYETSEGELESQDVEDSYVEANNTENNLNNILSYIHDFDYEDDPDGSIDDKEVLKATKFLTLYTKEGLDKYLKGLSRGVIRRAFDNLNKL